MGSTRRGRLTGRFAGRGRGEIRDRIPRRPVLFAVWRFTRFTFRVLLMFRTGVALRFLPPERVILGLRVTFRVRLTPDLLLPGI